MPQSDIFTICTILGGLVSLGYFWDKILGLFGRGPEIKWVHLGYPTESGLQQKIEKAGFSVRWASENNLANKKDSSVVTIKHLFRKSSIFKVKSGNDNLVLVKKGTHNP
jgi:hypothetical protein